MPESKKVLPESKKLLPESKKLLPESKKLLPQPKKKVGFVKILNAFFYIMEILPMTANVEMQQKIHQ